MAAWTKKFAGPCLSLQSHGSNSGCAFLTHICINTGAMANLCRHAYSIHSHLLDQWQESYAASFLREQLEQ